MKKTLRRMILYLRIICLGKERVETPKRHQEPCLLLLITTELLSILLSRSKIIPFRNKVFTQSGNIGKGRRIVFSCFSKNGFIKR